MLDRLLPIFLLLGTQLLVSCKQELPPYTTTNPLNEPVLFAEQALTTRNGINFSKDGRTIYLSNQLEQKFDNGRFYAGIFVSHYENGNWTTPKRLKFGLEIDAYHPVLSIDNQRLFFNSRSHLDSINKSIPHNIWVMHRTSDGWGKAEMVHGVNSSTYDSYPSIARNNNLYFNSDRPGGKGGMDIYVAHFVNGQYQEPINLAIINSPEVENDLVVDPDEQFIIFNRYIHATKDLDLFISFNKEDQWTAPRKLDEINSPDKWELTPTLSPNGKYFFYEVENQIMQIDLAMLTNQIN